MRNPRLDNNVHRVTCEHCYGTAAFKTAMRAFSKAEKVRLAEVAKSPLMTALATVTGLSAAEVVVTPQGEFTPEQMQAAVTLAFG